MCLIKYVKLYVVCFFFFFNDTATTEIYTLSLHDALPILLLLCCVISIEGTFYNIIPCCWRLGPLFKVFFVVNYTFLREGHIHILSCLVMRLWKKNIIMCAFFVFLKSISLGLRLTELIPGFSKSRSIHLCMHGTGSKLKIFLWAFSDIGQSTHIEQPFEYIWLLS